MRYYSTQPSITLENYPKPPFNPARKVLRYGKKTYCKELEQKVWGYIEYVFPISQEMAVEYGLVPAPSSIRAVNFIGVDSWGRETFADEQGRLWKYSEPGNLPRERHDQLHRSSGNALEGEPGWPMPPDLDYIIRK